MGINEVKKFQMINFKYTVWFFLLCFLISCSESRFVVKQHNILVNNLFESGKTTYSSNYYLRYIEPNSGLIRDSCAQSDILKRLDLLVPNELYSYPYCDFEISYEYLLNLRNYVANNRKRLLKNMTPISEKQYKDTLYYHDFIYYDSINPWSIFR